MSSPALNILAFKSLIETSKAANRRDKQTEIQTLLSFPGLNCHYCNKQTKRAVVANCEEFEFAHELHTSKKLTAEGYDVLLLPKGYFPPYAKKFDLFLLRGHLLLECDLKTITSINPATVGDRINDGSRQAKRLVPNILSGIDANTLIDGLRNGAERNKELFKIMLFYRSRFYDLPKDLILSRNIYKVLK